MKINNSIKFTVVFLIILSLVGSLILFGFSSGNVEKTTNPLDEFAKCLAGKNITMYGSENCSHCKNEAKNLGDAFRFVPYVECTKDPEKCVEAGIENFPTWVFTDGRKLVGEQGLEKLSKESGCKLP